MLTVLGAFAEFENDIRRERQRDGIKKAKAADHALRAQGKPVETYRGRPATIDPATVAMLRAEGLGATEIAKRLNIGRASVYRVAAGTTA